jgi:hypothetical protein
MDRTKQIDGGLTLSDVFYVEKGREQHIAIPFGAFADSTFPSPTVSVSVEQMRSGVVMPKDIEHVASANVGLMEQCGFKETKVPTMRLWTLHPRYLDAKGLVAAWREALLAQKVLRGATRGYRHHPQLLRFQAQRYPRAAIAAFLWGLALEADRRGFHFDRAKISRRKRCKKIPETSGQLRFEWGHLKKKLRVRAPVVARQCRGIATPDAHPLFRIVPGKVRPWEKS